jgi:type I restriction enzyme, S subunit
MIGMKDMVDSRIAEGQRTLVLASEGEIKSCTLNKGDLLLNRTNSPDLVGKLAIWDRAEVAVFASYLVRYPVRPDKALPRFTIAALSTRRSSQQIDRLITRAISQANINPSAFYDEVEIAVPPVQEQHRIVAVLDAWDGAIDKTERLISFKRSLRNWFRLNVLSGDKRLPNFKSAWKSMPLSAVLTEHKLSSSGKEPVFSVSVHKGLVNQIEHLGRSFSAADTGHYNRVLPDDVVYTKSPTGDFPLGIVKQSKIKEEVIVSPLYGVFSPASRSVGVLIDAIFESPIATQNYLMPLVQKGAKNTIAITNQRFLEGKITLPTDPAEQDTLAALLDASREEITRLQDSLESLRIQKRGLMQKLLTGEWQLDERFDPQAAFVKVAL